MLSFRGWCSGVGGEKQRGDIKENYMMRKYKGNNLDGLFLLLGYLIRLAMDDWLIYHFLLLKRKRFKKNKFWSEIRKDGLSADIFLFGKDGLDPLHTSITHHLQREFFSLFQKKNIKSRCDIHPNLYSYGDEDNAKKKEKYYLWRQYMKEFNRSYKYTKKEALEETRRRVLEGRIEED